MGSELVGDQDTGSAGLLANELAHQPLGGLPVTTALDQGDKHETVLIDGTSKPVLLAANRDGNLIQMPFVAVLGSATAELSGKIRSEFLGPTPDGRMADDDTPGGQQIFDHAQAERKSENAPDRLADDLRGKPVTAIKGIPNLNHAARIARKPTKVST